MLKLKQVRSGSILGVFARANLQHYVLFHLDALSLLQGIILCVIGSSLLSDAFNILFLKYLFAAIALLLLCYQILRSSFPCRCGLVLRESHIEPPFLRRKFSLVVTLVALAGTVILIFLIVAHFSSKALLATSLVFCYFGFFLLESGLRGFSFKFANRLRSLSKTNLDSQDFVSMSPAELKLLMTVALDAGELEKADAISRVMLGQIEAACRRAENS